MINIKIRTTNNLSLWLYEYFWIILLYGHLVYFILKVLAWEICNMKWGFAKKVLLKSQRQFMYGSNFYESDVSNRRHNNIILDWKKKKSWIFILICVLFFLFSVSTNMDKPTNTLSYTLDEFSSQMTSKIWCPIIWILFAE